ncbi:hypothetical protein [Candidatus Symbiopectobacterium sp.]|nr:hypothetical protein [Candidatus Symbiopectobacterium sp.]
MIIDNLLSPAFLTITQLHYQPECYRLTLSDASDLPYLPLNLFGGDA